MVGEDHDRRSKGKEMRFMNDILLGGYRSGEMIVYTAGCGKSLYYPEIYRKYKNDQDFTERDRKLKILNQRLGVAKARRDKVQIRLIEQEIKDVNLRYWMP